MDLLTVILKLVAAVISLAASLVKFMPKTPSDARKEDDRPRR